MLPLWTHLRLNLCTSKANRSEFLGVWNNAAWFFRVIRSLRAFLYRPHTTRFVQCNGIAPFFPILIKCWGLSDFCPTRTRKKTNIFSKNYPPKWEEQERSSRKRYRCEVWLFLSDLVYFLHWKIYFASTWLNHVKSIKKRGWPSVFMTTDLSAGEGMENLRTSIEDVKAVTPMTKEVTWTTHPHLASRLKKE